MNKKLLLTDCDGTLRESASGEKFIHNPRDQQIINGADKAIAYYHFKGWLIIGISNQAGVNAGHKSLEDVIAGSDMGVVVKQNPYPIWITYNII